MIITILRSGGFAGITIKKTVDSSTLQPEEAKKIEELAIKGLQLTSSHLAKPQPDRFNYTITVKDGTKINTVNINETDLSNEIQQIINFSLGQTGNSLFA